MGKIGYGWRQGWARARVSAELCEDPDGLLREFKSKIVDLIGVPEKAMWRREPMMIYERDFETRDAWIRFQARVVFSDEQAEETQWIAVPQRHETSVGELVARIEAE